ncbi:MAG: AAA family ATPase [Acidilobaceae archaeon]|nr:AAA family ATPase [Acidilobaceae archaeon]
MIVAVTGMPGSGKSVAAKAIARALGLPLISMGDIVREEARRRGIEITSESIEELARQLRREKGPAAVAQMVMERTKPPLVVDGVRSLEEVELFSRYAEVCIVAVHSPPRLRFKRMLERRREGDALTEGEFRERDLSNLRLGVGSVIALADYVIINVSTQEELEAAARRVAEEIRRGSCRG